ncbi:MAG: hypothetical protein R3E68_19800 [Burkholderiaceae bacterium]
MLTLWSVIVAQRLGLDRNEALTLGKALSGLTAHAKGTRLGIFEPTPDAVKALRAQRRADAGVVPVAFMGRQVPVVQTDADLRAVSRDKAIDPASGAIDHLAGKFGESLDEVSQAMQELADSRTSSALPLRSSICTWRFGPMWPGASAAEVPWAACRQA